MSILLKEHLYRNTKQHFHANHQPQTKYKIHIHVILKVKTMSLEAQGRKITCTQKHFHTLVKILMKKIL